MKTPIIASIAAAALLLTTGCSIIQNTKKFVVKGDAATEDVRPSSAKTTTPANTAPKNSEKKASVTPPKTVAQEIEAKQSQDYTTILSQPDVKPVVAPVVEASESDTVGQPSKITVADLTQATPLAKNLQGEWQIIQVCSTIIDRDEDIPYIVFEPSTAAFYANNGCNTLNGAYSVDKSDKITFHNVLSTMRLCADTDFDSQINVIIGDNVTTQLRMTEVGQETFVDFVTSTGKTLMRMRRGNLDFLNGNWDVVSIHGISELEVPANLFFDLAELKLHGNTGCNYINGTIYLDHRRSNAIDFSNMITTRMACPYNNQQTAMLVALEQTESAISDGSNSVMFLDANGRNLMTLHRAENQNPDAE